MNDFLIIGNVSDEPFAIDLGHLCGQAEDVSDIIALKTYANSEFCPRFISDENDYSRIGTSLRGKTVVICSTSTQHTRGALAMRTLILARAAKDNGADKVLLVEPDLFFSAQDRGPHRNLDGSEDRRTREDLKKFDGQPFTSQLYAELLKSAGVDSVITVHNHSVKVQNLFHRHFDGEFYNLLPHDIYADYIRYSDMVVTGKEGDNLVLCSPDEGAMPFMNGVYDALHLGKTNRIVMQKHRTGERQVSMSIAEGSDLRLEGIEGKDIIVLDDMVRTGSTILECCRLLRQGNPNRICFCVTHFNSSAEARENLNSRLVDEILTLNTIPSVLNRDTQGRLRKKMTVLKIEKWIARFLMNYMGHSTARFEKNFYAVDMSSKNPRWRPH